MAELKLTHKIVLGAPRLVRGCEVPSDVLEFLVSRDGGEGILHALYDHVLEETVPARIIELVQRYERPVYGGADPGTDR